MWAEGEGREHWNQKARAPEEPVGSGGGGVGEGEWNNYNGMAVNEHTFKYQPDLQVPPT